jgi:dTDP-4-dehydrorhamnose 3,5-epimerase-like enzyme
MNDKILEIMERVANEFLSMSDEEHRKMRTNPKYDVEIPGVTLDEDDPMWDEIEQMSFMEYKYED